MGRGEARLSNVGLRQMVYLSVTPISISRHQSPPDRRGHIHQHHDSLTFPLRPTKSTSTQAKFSHCVCLGQNNAKLTHLPYKPDIRCQHTCFFSWANTSGSSEHVIFPRDTNPRHGRHQSTSKPPHTLWLRAQTKTPSLWPSPANLILDPSGQ